MHKKKIYDFLGLRQEETWIHHCEKLRFNEEKQIMWKGKSRWLVDTVAVAVLPEVRKCVRTYKTVLFPQVPI